MIDQTGSWSYLEQHSNIIKRVRYPSDECESWGTHNFHHPELVKINQNFVYGYTVTNNLFWEMGYEY